ncbi:hypothetical protein ACG83_10155 [Frankia sp. R43]|uniref:hypothetical protein n=1 Tax=Frankia sp. R43 TaxID=269536 RepID=UPI0006CA2666|nr:hypothetical protein [Frankia sp. R43]KPM55645.1 hypothetical protein ACG83_10155 [Frankia sp. R43]
MTGVPDLDDFAHGTVTMADVRAWHGTEFFPGDDPGTVTEDWAHSLVDIFDEPAHSTRYARFCNKVAASNQLRDYLRERAS